MAIDLTKFPDPWGDIGGGGVLGDASPVLAATPATSWLGVGLQVLKMFSGDSEQNAASSSSGGQINSSGWVVGEGDAQGGTLATSQGLAALPWYIWATGALVGIAIAKRSFA